MIGTITRRLICSACGVLLLLQVMSVAYGANEPVGYFKNLKGSAKVRHPLGKLIVIENEQPFYKGSKIKTEKNTELTLNFVDGSIVSLGASTLFRVKEKSSAVGKKTQLNLFQGHARTEVHKLGKQQVFQICTPVAVAGVRGTLFDTTVSPKAKTLVHCHSTEGSGVMVQSVVGSQVVGAGYQAGVLPSGKIKMIKVGADGEGVTSGKQESNRTSGKQESELTRTDKKQSRIEEIMVEVSKEVVDTLISEEINRMEKQKLKIKYSFEDGTK